MATQQFTIDNYLDALTKLPEYGGYEALASGLREDFPSDGSMTAFSASPLDGGYDEGFFYSNLPTSETARTGGPFRAERPTWTRYLYNQDPTNTTYEAMWPTLSRITNPNIGTPNVGIELAPQRFDSPTGGDLYQGKTDDTGGKEHKGDPYEHLAYEQPTTGQAGSMPAYYGSLDKQNEIANELEELQKATGTTPPTGNIITTNSPITSLDTSGSIIDTGNVFSPNAPAIVTAKQSDAARSYDDTTGGAERYDIAPEQARVMKERPVAADTGMIGTEVMRPQQEEAGTIEDVSTLAGESDLVPGNQIVATNTNNYVDSTGSAYAKPIAFNFKDAWNKAVNPSIDVVEEPLVVTNQQPVDTTPAVENRGPISLDIQPAITDSNIAIDQIALDDAPFTGISSDQELIGDIPVSDILGVPGNQIPIDPPAVDPAEAALIAESVRNAGIGALVNPPIDAPIEPPPAPLPQPVAQAGARLGAPVVVAKEPLGTNVANQQEGLGDSVFEEISQNYAPEYAGSLEYSAQGDVGSEGSAASAGTWIDRQDNRYQNPQLGYEAGIQFGIPGGSTESDTEGAEAILEILEEQQTPDKKELPDPSVTDTVATDEGELEEAKTRIQKEPFIDLPAPKGQTRTKDESKEAYPGADAPMPTVKGVPSAEVDTKPGADVDPRSSFDGDEQEDKVLTKRADGRVSPIQKPVDPPVGQGVGWADSGKWGYARTRNLLTGGGLPPEESVGPRVPWQSMGKDASSTRYLSNVGDRDYFPSRLAPGERLGETTAAGEIDYVPEGQREGWNKPITINQVYPGVGDGAGEPGSPMNKYLESISDDISFKDIPGGLTDIPTISLRAQAGINELRANYDINTLKEAKNVEGIANILSGGKAVGSKVAEAFTNLLGISDSDVKSDGFWNKMTTPIEAISTKEFGITPLDIALVIAGGVPALGSVLMGKLASAIFKPITGSISGMFDAILGGNKVEFSADTSSDASQKAVSDIQSVLKSLGQNSYAISKGTLYGPSGNVLGSNMQSVTFDSAGNSTFAGDIRVGPNDTVHWSDPGKGGTGKIWINGEDTGKVIIKDNNGELKLGDSKTSGASVPTKKEGPTTSVPVIGVSTISTVVSGPGSGRKEDENDDEEEEIKESKGR